MIVPSPIVISVPHAGRDYPEALLRQSALPPENLRQLEDRHVDRLTHLTPDAGHRVLIARTARAWIDLNRDPAEIDAAMIDPAHADYGDVRAAAQRKDRNRVLAGLGLIPKQVSGLGDIYRRKLDLNDVRERIRSVHMPWHDSIENATGQAWENHGFSVLIDLHSMPSIRPGQAGHGHRVVIGDRHGKSCDPALARSALSLFRQAGIPAGMNQPYAGAYTLERHGKPAESRHALQIEIDRALYLTADGVLLDHKAEALAQLIRQLCQRLAIDGQNIDQPLAAE